MSRRRFMNHKVDKEIVSLFHCDDANGTDAKGYAKVSDRQLSSTSGKFSNGNQGYVRYQDRQWDDLFLSNSWTIDYWIYPRTASDWAVDIFLGGSDNAYAILREQSNGAAGLLFFVGNGAYWFLNNGGVSVSMNTWHHVAVVYDGKTCSIYADGQRYHHFNCTFTSVPGSQNIFGAGWNGGKYKSNSYRDEIRISKGVRWTSNFIPPTRPSYIE